jgi:2-methylisocitrate lyase-like PEP mutase family enzyme
VSNDGSSRVSKAEQLRALHEAEDLLLLVNVWDVATARTVAEVPGTRALATASHSIAEAHGYEDGQNIPFQLMLAAVQRIVDAVDLPVTADLESGYGDVGRTIRAAIGVGAVGANLEDELRPFAESVGAVREAMAAAAAEGVPFVLNARTDAYLLGGDRDPAVVLADAVERGRAFLDEGAACVFVPGVADPAVIAQLVEGIGVRKVSVIARPGGPTMAELAALGVARVSCGPYPQIHLLTGLAELSRALLAGDGFPA